MVACVVCFCSVTQDPAGGADDVSDLEITSADISNWTARTDGSCTGACIYIGEAVMYDSPINGAGQIYVDLGVLQSLFQYMEAPSGNPSIPFYLEAYAMDFGTADAAKAMFDEKVQSVSAPSAMLGYDISVVAIDESTPYYGCTVFAHFGKFYIELKFNNYEPGGPGNPSVEDAALFVPIYEAKITA